MNKHNKTNNTALTFKDLLKRAFVFLLPTLLIAIIFTILFSLIFYNMPDSTSKISLCSSLSMYFTAFFAGFILSKVNGQKYLVGSALLGLILFAINVILALIIKSDFGFSQMLMKLLIPFTCVCGGILGIKREKKHLRKKRF